MFSCIVLPDDSRQFIANRSPAIFREEGVHASRKSTDCQLLRLDMGTIVIEEVFLDACWKSLEHIKDVKRFHVGLADHGETPQLHLISM